MKRVRRISLPFLGLLTLIFPLGCMTAQTHIESVSARRIGQAYGFTSVEHPGEFDPEPLLRKEITVGGKAPSTVAAQFSAYLQPTDNHVLFQVTLDGEPMEGHAPDFPELGQGVRYGVPVVSEPERYEVRENGTENPDQRFAGQARTVSYTFFKEVDPGPHVVEVRVATCCHARTELGTLRIHAATLTLHHR